jgi:hypothetical protein
MWKPTKIRSILLVCGLMSMTACATQAVGGNTGGRMIGDGQTFTMHAGERVTFADASALRYVRVANDSRCPPGVQCIWAGDAEVAFEWTSGSGAVTAFSLHTGKDPKQQALGERRLTLVSLARGEAPDAELRIDRNP